MKKQLFIFCILNLVAHSFVYAKDSGVPTPPGVVASPYEACRDVIIVSKEKHQENAEKWKSFESSCNKKVQVVDEAGITKMGPLVENIHYLDLVTKVAKKVIITLDKSNKYAQCSSACFSGAKTCNADIGETGKVIDCKERREEVSKAMKIQSKKIRMELALSEVSTNFVQNNIKNFLTVDDDKRFNKNLSDFEVGTPNPLGHTEMQPNELKYARAMIKSERAKVEEDYKIMLEQKGIKDSEKVHDRWVSKALMDQIERRKNEHREKYRQLIYEQSPIFAVIDKPSTYKKGGVPVWDDKQIAMAFTKLSENAKKTKKSVQESIENGKLEFKRVNGEALWKWMTGNHHDLLYYIGMKKQVEEVLSENKDLCGAASTLSDRLSSKELQNMGSLFVASFAGGAASKGLSLGIGAMAAANVTGLVGLSIGASFLGDSFRQYDKSIAEVTSGIGEAKDIESAKENIALNLAIPVVGAGAGVILTKSAADTKRILLSEQLLGRKLTPQINKAIKLAHEVGMGELGKDGKTLAGVGNYTTKQLAKKAKILDSVGINKEERRILVENGVVGRKFDEFNNMDKPTIDGFRKIPPEVKENVAKDWDTLHFFEKYYPQEVNLLDKTRTIDKTRSGQLMILTKFQKSDPLDIAKNVTMEKLNLLNPNESRTYLIDTKHTFSKVEGELKSVGVYGSEFRNTYNYETIYVGEVGQTFTGKQELIYSKSPVLGTFISGVKITSTAGKSIIVKPGDIMGYTGLKTANNLVKHPVDISRIKALKTAAKIAPLGATAAALRAEYLRELHELDKTTPSPVGPPK